MEFPVKLLLTPVMIIWALLLFTVLQQWRAQRRLPRAATVTFLLFWLFCTKPVVDQLAKPLELAYPAFAAASSTTSAATTSAKPALAHILVLGCNHQDSSFLPLTSKAEPCTLARLSEGIRLWHLYPEAVLHVSGHIAERSQSHTEFARQYAIAMGVAPAKIVSHSEASNTKGEVQSFIAAIDQQPAVVVTSAMHMPRTCNWFAHYGGRVIAAPTDFYVRRLTGDIGWQGWLPSAQSLHALSYVFYEYMGLVQQYIQRMTDHNTAPTTAVGCMSARS
ncbi:YdcF family protein [Rheinheimera riviphila]|nr:ElyC/SanA/YdcF family protein [Rheinheimera riviphila]